MTREERAESHDSECQPATPDRARFGNDGRRSKQLIKQYTEMRQMMSSCESGMFGGGGLRGKMMRRMAGMPGMEGGGGDQR